MLEPFGIFNFLKTLLPAMDFQPNNPALNMENKEKNPPSAQAENVENTQTEQIKNIPPAENISAQRNAFTQFIENHDSRVKRTKKDWRTHPKNSRLSKDENPFQKPIQKTITKWRGLSDISPFVYIPYTLPIPFPRIFLRGEVLQR